jgi:hypothetical protein
MHVRDGSTFTTVLYLFSEGAHPHSEADIPLQSLSETLAELKNALGVVLTSKLEPE